MTGMPMDVADPYGLLHPELNQNPYPLYARLLREAPVHFSEPWGGWVVVRYADVNEGLRDTIDLPIQEGDTPGEVVVIVPFLDPVMQGKFVYHCHILEHEDGGMMATLQVNPRSTAQAERSR